MRAALVLTATLLAGCLTPHPPNGTVGCGSGHSCPDSYFCDLVSNTCYRNGSMPGSGGDDMGVAGSCSDRVQNGDETDVDCGDSCPACVVGKMCGANGDCASGNCDSGTHLCASLQCQNGAKDGDETDVDCGGGVCATCAQGKMCKMGSDCTTTLCSSGGVCITSCQNGTKDGTETDVDCGGAACSPCAVDLKCAVDADCVSGSCKSMHCIPASGPPGWVTMAAIPSQRTAVVATTAPDGRIFVIGGNVSGSATTRVDIYNPTTNAWDPSPPALPSARMYATAATYLSAIYVFGGDGPTGNLVTSSAVFSTSWTDNALPAMPLASGSGAATLGPDNKFYIAGGEVGTGTAGNYGKVTEVYDPTLNTWSQLPLLANIHGGPGSAWGSDGHLYVIAGGDVEDVTTTATVEMYDPAQSKWVLKAPVSAARVYLNALAAPDGRIYAFGGNGTNGTLSEAYRPALDLWVTTSPLKVANNSAGAALAPDGRMFMLGGITATTQAYGPAVTMSPTTANKGAAVTVNGNNFAGNAHVTVLFDGTPIGMGMTDAFGGLTAAISFNVPNVGSGPHVVKVVDDKSVYPITLKLTVN